MIYEICAGSYFWQWLQSSGSDKNSFSYDGAKALQDYLEELTDGADNQEFDPIAWCCDFTEYSSAYEAMQEYAEDDDRPTGIAEKEEAAALEWLQDRTTAITFNNGIIIQGF
jgi:hypothetical protein